MLEAPQVITHVRRLAGTEARRAGGYATQQALGPADAASPLAVPAADLLG